VLKEGRIWWIKREDFMDLEEGYAWVKISIVDPV
jgi:hypothetical protein